MHYRNDQYRVISEAVMEQLGIEEDEDAIEEIASMDELCHEIDTLKSELSEKEAYIHKLELKLISESKRIDLLERIVYKLKR